MQWKSGISNLLLGISIGVLIGAGFFMFKINELFSSLKEQLLNQKFQLIEKVYKSDKDTTDTKTEAKNKKNNPFKINLKNTVKINYRQIDSLIQPKESDSLLILQEKLEATRLVRVICLPPDTSGTSAALEIRLEYYNNPFNSRGYVFNSPLLKLYGINSSYVPDVFCYKNRFFIRLWDDIYEIFPGGEEQKSFVKSPNEEIKKYINGSL
jgi:hypothetical protein